MRVILALLIIGLTVPVFGQNIGINTDGTAGSTLLHTKNTTAATDNILRIENTIATQKSGINILNSGTANSNWLFHIPASSTDLRLQLYSGTDAVTFLNNGNVGIGNTSPVHQLHVSTEAASPVRGLGVSEHMNSIAAALITTRKSRGTFATPLTVAAGDYIGHLQANPYVTTSGYITTGSLGFHISSASTVTATDAPTEFYISTTTTSAGDPFSFANAVQMIIKNSGNVGFGTTTPNTNLVIDENNTDVLGALKITQSGTGDASMFFGLPGVSAWSLGIDNSDADKFKIGNDLANADVGVNTRLTIDNSGNVGIGTTAPGSLLEISGTGSTQGTNPAMLLLTATTDNPGIVLNAAAATSKRGVIMFQKAGVADFSISNWNGAHKFVIWDDVSGLQEFSIYNSKATIGDPGGSAPANKFNVIGNASIGSTYYNYSAPANGMIVEGFVGIGTGTVTPKGILHLENGNARITTYDTDAAGPNAGRPAWLFGAQGASFAVQSAADYTTAATWLSINPTGSVTVSSLTGTGSSLVQTDASGNLSRAGTASFVDFPCSQISNQFWTNVSWNTCVTNCKNYNGATAGDGGYNDWRTPDVAEYLYSVLNFAAPTGGWQGVYFWTRDADVTNTPFMEIFNESGIAFAGALYSSALYKCRCAR